MRIKRSKYGENKIVSDKLKVAAFKYLKHKIKSKESTIDYGDGLKMQNYLKPNKVMTFEEQNKIFS